MYRKLKKNPDSLVAALHKFSQLIVQQPSEIGSVNYHHCIDHESQT